MLGEGSYSVLGEGSYIVLGEGSYIALGEGGSVIGEGSRVTGGIPKGSIGSNLYQSVALGEGYKLSKGRVRVSSSLQIFGKILQTRFCCRRDTSVVATALIRGRVTGGIPKGLIGSNLYQSVALGEGYKLSKGRVRVSSSLQSNRQNTANALLLSPGSMLATRQS